MFRTYEAEPDPREGEPDEPAVVEESAAEAPQPADQVPGAGEHASDEAALAEAGAELDAVEVVLGRLEDGSFDHCQVCGAPIGRDRLMQDPLLTRCPQHAAAGTAGPVPG